MDKQIKETIAQVFDDIAAGLSSGSFAKRIRVGLTTHGSEHGEAEMLRGAALAMEQDKSIEVVTLRMEDAKEAHSIMDSMLADGSLDAAVTMHYSFPIGISTVGRVITPGKGRQMLVASTTGTSDTERASALLKNAISGIAVAKALGKEQPTVGILNLDGARQLERALIRLSEGGYPVAFAGSAREDGGAVMRGNDLLQGVPDVMVMDSLTGNVAMKVMSAYTTGGSYESLGDGYGPGVGEGCDKIVGIISRASGAPVVAGALCYMAACARGGLIKHIAQEFASCKKAGLDELLAGFAAAEKKPEAEETVTMPPEKVATEEIPGIEILELEDAVRVLWKRGIYASSGMGCTGPVIMVAGDDHAVAMAVLKEAKYL